MSQTCSALPSTTTGSTSVATYTTLQPEEVIQYKEIECFETDFIWGATTVLLIHPISMSVSSIGNFGRLLRAMKRAIRILGKQRRSKVGGKRGRRKGGRGGDDNFLEPIVRRKRAKVKSELILHNSYYNLSWAVIFLIFVIVRFLNKTRLFLRKWRQYANSVGWCPDDKSVGE